MQEHSIARGSTTSLHDVNDIPAHWSRNRRDFLRILGSGAAIAALGTLAACSSGHAASRSDELRSQLLADERFWAGGAGMFTLGPARRFLNVGTAGSMPKVSLDVFDSENLAKARESGNGYTNLLAERTQMAPGFGVDPDELAFSANTSSGMCHAILGMDWQPGGSGTTRPPPCTRPCSTAAFANCARKASACAP